MCSILSVVIRTMGGHGSHPAPQRPDRHPCHQRPAPAAVRPAALRRRRPCPGARLQPPAPGVEDGPRRDLPGPVPGDRRDELRGARHGRCPLGRVGTLRVGDPKGICNRDAGPRQNLRLRTWRRTHLIGALKDKAELAGIRVVEVDERGTSSTCLLCRQKVPKPRGRTFRCSFCGFSGHRDLVGAANIAARGGGVICGNPRIEHRRVGAPPTRRDRRRHRYDERRSCLAHGRRGSQGSRSRSPKGAERKACPSVSRTQAGSPAIGEEPLPGVLLQEGAG